MVTIGKRTKIYAILFFLLALAFLVGFSWYLVSVLSRYSVLLLSMTIVFGLLFSLFFVLFLLDFRQRKDGVYRNGERLILRIKGKERDLSLKNVKEISYRSNHNNFFSSSTGSLFLDDYEVKDILNVKKVASSLLKIQRNLLEEQDN